MTTEGKHGSTNSTEKRLIRVGIVLLAYAGWWYYTNPVRLHQKVQVGSVTVAVPFGWYVSQQGTHIDGGLMLRRAFVPFLGWSSASIGAMSSQTWTRKTAESAQAQRADWYRRAPYANPSIVEMKGPKYTALCAGATMQKSDAYIMDCWVVGTPLSFSFMSSGSSDEDWVKILDGLE